MYKKHPHTYTYLNVIYNESYVGFTYLYICNFFSILLHLLICEAFLNKKKKNYLKTESENVIIMFCLY